MEAALPWGRMPKSRAKMPDTSSMMRAVSPRSPDLVDLKQLTRSRKDAIGAGGEERRDEEEGDAAVGESFDFFFFVLSPDCFFF
jgi:hypothetical protein